MGVKRFQSTLPQGEWPQPEYDLRLFARFQSTLPQGEWPHDAQGKVTNELISIHTPARGVTFQCFRLPSKSVISIHTPARGVTPQFRKCHFAIFISIHTPARGVTSYILITSNGFEFQSTLPQGEWHDLYIQRVVIQFISIHTPARGVTRIRTPTTVSKKYFNPHSRKGSDHKIRNSPCYKVISIHTPARGVTCTYYLNPSNNEFQSTLPQGEWPRPRLSKRVKKNFNPHSRKGSDARIDFIRLCI